MRIVFYLALFTSLFIFFVPLSHAQTRKIDSLNSVLKTAKDITKVRVLLQLAEYYFNADLRKLKIVGEEAYSLSKRINYKKGIIESCNRIGMYYGQLLDDKQAMQWYKKSLNLSIQEKDTLFISRNLDHMGALFYDRGELSKALNYYNQALKLRIASKDSSGIAKTYNQLGAVQYLHGNSEKAMDYYFKSLEILEKLGDTANASIALINIAEGYGAQNNEQKFLEYCHSALKKLTAINDLNTKAYVYYNIGSYYLEKKENSKALEHFIKSIAISKKMDNQYLLTSNSIGISKIYLAQTKYNLAKENLTFALNIARKNQDLRSVSSSLTALGEIDVVNKKYAEAIFKFEESLQILKKEKLYAHVNETYFQLTNAYKESGNFSKAFEYQSLGYQLKDSLDAVSNSKAVAEMQSKYESEKKEKAIALLAKNNKIKDLKLAQNNVIITSTIIGSLLVLVLALVFYNRYRIKKKADEEKEVLLKEIHHRVKNNLQLVISLLEWQAENEEDEKVFKIIDEGRSRVESMALIHESLYKTNNLAKVNSKQYIENLVGYLETSYRKREITIKKNLEDIYLDVDTTIPLGLIVNELVSNCYKYAFPFPQEALISIELVNKNSIYYLKVEDNGIGLPGELKDITTNSLGLQLVQTLVKQLKGSLNVKVEAGTKFEITFKDPEVSVSSKQKREKSIV